MKDDAKLNKGQARPVSLLLLEWEDTFSMREDLFQ